MHASPALAWVSGDATPVKVLVTRVFNFGTFDEWKQMRREISPETILDAVEHPLPGQWTPRGKAFAECLYERTLPDTVLISYA